MTIGTLDGANVEIREEAGAENFFLFGLTVDEVERIQRDGHRPTDHVDGNPDLAAVLESIAGGTFSHGDTEVFRPLVDDLRFDDPFLVLADYAAYVDCQERVSTAWQDQAAWSRISILEQLHALMVTIIAGESRAHDRAGIAEDHAGRPKPSPRMSSDRSPTSLRFARPEPKNAGGHDRCPARGTLTQPDQESA